jgi:hypothetical protein
MIADKVNMLALMGVGEVAEVGSEDGLLGSVATHAVLRG